MPRTLNLSLPKSGALDALDPSIEIYGYEDGDGECVGPDVEACYLELFPVAEERDAFSDIRHWLEPAHQDPSLDYREMLCVLRAGAVPIGLAYYTIYPGHGWAFASYFGVLAQYRASNLAARLADAIRRFLTVEHPQLHGVLFEVEVLDLGVVPGAADLPVETADRLRRLAIYASHSSVEVACDDDGVLAFRQPALTAPLEPDHEVALYLMRQRWRDPDPDGADSVANAVKFVLRHIYGDVYIEGETSIPGFGAYVSDLERSILGARPDRLVWKRLSLSVGERTLLRQVTLGRRGQALRAAR